MAEWFETLDPETLAHATTKGWALPDAAAAATAAIKAHAGAEKLIGHPADQTLKLPKDGSDPSFQAAYDRVMGMATPKTADEYKIEGASEDDAKFVREIAAKNKLPAPVAQQLAAELAARGAGATAAATAAAETTKAANRAAIMASWGADFDRKSFSATQAAEVSGLPPTILAHLATLPSADYIAGMNALVALGEKMGEAAMLRGGGRMTPDSTAGMTGPDATARLQALGNDSAWVAKFRAHDAAAVSEWTKLTTIVAASRVAPR
jgi:hypothetical protein